MSRPCIDGVQKLHEGMARAITERGLDTWRTTRGGPNVWYRSDPDGWLSATEINRGVFSANRDSAEIQVWIDELRTLVPIEDRRVGTAGRPRIEYRLVDLDAQMPGTRLRLGILPADLLDAMESAVRRGETTWAAIITHGSRRNHSQRWETDPDFRSRANISGDVCVRARRAGMTREEVAESLPQWLITKMEGKK